MNVRLNLYLNTGIQIRETVTGANHVSIDSYVIPRQTCPFQVSPISNDSVTGSGFSVPDATTLNYLLKIGNSTLSNCRFYASMYNLTPQAESDYLSNPTRKILYDDVVQFCIPGVGPTQNVNNLITSGISKLRGFLMVPRVSHGADIRSIGLSSVIMKMKPMTTPVNQFKFYFRTMFLVLATLILISISIYSFKKL